MALTKVVRTKVRDALPYGAQRAQMQSYCCHRAVLLGSQREADMQSHLNRPHNREGDSVDKDDKDKERNNERS